MSSRPAIFVDAKVIAEVEVAAWRAAYAQLLAADSLAGLSVDRAAAAWRGFLLDVPADSGVLVAVADERVCGFVSYGPAADSFRADRIGEVRSLYVAPEAWRAGHGRALLSEAEAKLAAHGFRTAILWVLPGNQPARRFYETCGWNDDQIERVGSLGGRPVPHVRYSLPMAREAKESPTGPLS